MSIINEYKSAVNYFIFEKSKYNENSPELAKKRKKTIALAKDLFQFSDKNGKKFNDAFIKDLEIICSMRVGRKLIKSLAGVQEATKVEYRDNHNQPTGQYYYPKKIYIHESSDGSSQKESDIFVDYANYTYESINSTKIPYLTVPYIAHELIHLLHEWNNSLFKSISCCNTGESLIENMDDLEEQQTIIGLNSILIELKGVNNLNRIDFLCENIFLLALGLPARINHRGEKETLPTIPKIALDVKKVIENIKNYYAWLETVIPIALPDESVKISC